LSIWSPVPLLLRNISFPVLDQMDNNLLKSHSYVLL